MEVVNNPEDPSAGTRAGRVRPRAVDRARRLHGGAGPQVLPAVARPRGPAPERVLRHLSRRSSRTRQARSSSSAARTTRRPAAATRPTAARSRRRSTGSRRPTPSRPRSACTTTCSRAPTPGADGDLFADLNPASETIVRGAMLEPALAEARARRDGPVRAPGLLHAGLGLTPGALVFNRTMTLKDSWAKAQARV